MKSKTTFRFRSAALFYFLLTVCGGCIRENRQTLIEEHSIHHDTHSVIASSVMDGNNIFIEAVLKGDLANGELFLVTRIKNKTSDEIMVDLSGCNLSVDEDREAIPDLQGQLGINTIMPETEAEYKISYHPVNSVDFYDRTDYRGDMKKKYGLRLDFIKDKNSRRLVDDLMLFEFSDKDYQSYLSNAKEKSMHIYDFDFQSEKFVQDQTQYLDRIFSDASNRHEIFAITPALTIDRTVINFRTFKEQDTLTVDMRLLNQSSTTLDVIVNRCAVEIAGKVFNPCEYYSDSFSGGKIDSVYIFKPGTRLHLDLKYCIATEVDQWKLVNEWLLIHQSNSVRSALGKTPFFYSGISFRESPITRDR